MSLKVINPKTQPTLKVGNGTGLQNANNTSYTVQNGSNAAKVQNAGSGNIQGGSGLAIQNGSSSKIQNAATAAQIQNAVNTARIIAAQEVARQKQVLKTNTQNAVNTKAATNKSALKLKVAATPKMPALKLGKAPALKLTKQKQTEYDKEYAKAYKEALADFDKQRKSDGKKNLLQKGWDKLTFGQDRRDVAAREYAAKKAAGIMEKDFAKYEQRILAYNRIKARAQADIASAVETMTSQAEFDKFVAEQQAMVDKMYAGLEKDGAIYDAKVSAYGQSSERALTSFTANALRKTKDVAAVPGKFIWRSTLGSGWENVPSIVSAPARVANWMGNINTNDRTIYKHDQTTMNRLKTGKNAWQATFNQREGNHKPYVDFTKANAPQALKDEVKQLIAVRKKIGTTDPAKLDYDTVLDGKLEVYNRNHRTYNSLAMVAKDPINYSGGAGLVKNTKWGAKLGSLAKTSKATGWAYKGANTVSTAVKSNKAVKWLGSEHKTHANRVSDAVTQELDDIAIKNPQIKNLVTAWQKNKGVIKSQAKMDEFKKVSDDFLALSKDEVKMFQKYVRSRDDWTKVRNADKLSPVQKTKLDLLSKKYQSTLEDLLTAEQKSGIAVKRRAGYLPQYQGKFSLGVKKQARKITGNDSWWFTKQQKTQKVQSKEKLMKSLAARRYDSRVARKDLPVLRDMVAGRADVGRNIDRIENMHKLIKKSKWEKFTDVASAPTKLWKKSVLLANPAWYVNNEIFNQIQGGIAGGLKFYKNQRGTQKYLQHIATNSNKRFLPSQAKKMVDDVASNVSKEVGKSKLAKFASKQEGRSRIALYRTFRQNGLSHDEAVKRLDRSLFSYNTKNWERPIKTVVPFWAWQKGLGKAGARMSLDHPVAAQGFNKLDKYQDQRMNDHFDQAVPELKKLGYTDAEIEEMRKEAAKYNKGKFRIGDTYFNTPFNAFSERGMDALGINPFIAAGAEVAGSTNFYGQKERGFESSFIRRFASKFPQIELGLQGKRSLDVMRGTSKPVERYRGGKGSDGIGYGKEKQGYNSSKKNYVANMDPRRNLGQNALAFVGVPRRTTVNMNEFVERKKLQKITDEYFKTDWHSMEWADQEKGQAALFKKYGVTSDQFFEGILSKYDTAITSGIKDQKKAAKIANGKLLDEYGKQPEGTRSKWAVNKLRELNASGYYKDNPFLYRFDWMTPDTVYKADKSTAYLKAKNTGDWLSFNQKYGDNRSAKAKDYEKAKKSGNWDAYQKKYGVKSQKAKDYRAATASGDWTDYTKKYGRKATAFQYEDKYFKSKESMEKYKSGKFWREYAKASKTDRRKMLADNPEYNTRANWTAKQWEDQRAKDKAELKTKARGFGNFASVMDAAITTNKKGAATFLRSRKGYQKKVTWKYAK